MILCRGFLVGENNKYHIWFHYLGINLNSCCLINSNQSNRINNYHYHHQNIMNIIRHILSILDSSYHCYFHNIQLYKLLYKYFLLRNILHCIECRKIHLKMYILHISDYNYSRLNCL